jgi:predicted transcriptional regulator
MGWNIQKEKTVEVRKNYPKAEAWDKTAKIYCSKNKNSFAMIPKEYQPLMQQFIGKVIGEFVCDEIYILFEAMAGIVVADQNWCAQDPIWFRNASCLTDAEICNYLNEKTGYAWHISDLVIYDEPKELSEFKRWCDGVSRNIGCRGCEYYYTESNESIGFYEECGCDNLRPLKRPPQSWCYVERSEG